MSDAKKRTNGKPKRSTVRHTRALQYDRAKRPTLDAPDEQIEQLLTQLVQPATFAQIAHFQRLGLRERTLTLPVMVAFVLSLLWRGIGAVKEAVRVLNREGLLWTAPLKVSQQAMSERLRTLPPELFAGVLFNLLPGLAARWQARKRPLPAAIAWAKAYYTDILSLDGSTLDALSRKVGLLREALHPLAGRMAALLDVASCLPRQVWYEEDSQAHDQRFWERAMAALEPGVLLLFDLGFVNHALFDHLSTQGIVFITRAKSNASLRVQTLLREGPNVRDALVTLGRGHNRCQQTMRLVAVLYKGKWFRYLTNELDPRRLPTEYVIVLYWQRWRIEEAFLIVKRLLGLAYFVAGSVYAVQTQLWATWVLYAVLVDLTDAVAEELHQPFACISREMVFRGLYHFTQARQRGQADDPVRYLAQEARGLGVLKQKRPKSLDALALLTNQLKS